MALLRDFSGGLNTRLAPSLIAPNEAQVLINVDASSGSIRPIKGSVLHTSGVNKYFTYYNAGSQFYSSATETSYVEYRDILYMTKANSYPTKTNGSTTHRLGIVGPLRNPTVHSGTHGVSFGKGIEVSKNIANLTSGTYKYLVVSSTVFYELSVKFTTSTGGLISIFAPPLAQVYRDYNGTYRLVDTVASNDLWVEDKVLNIGANTEFTGSEPALPDINSSYVVTFYSSATGAESQPSPVRIVNESLYAIRSRTTGKSSMTVGYYEVSTDPQVDKIRLYRLGGALTQYTLVTELPNANFSYTDKASDIDIAGNHILESFHFAPAPDNLKYLTEAYAMLFGTIGDKLYYSDIAFPDAWPVTNFLDFDDTITGIGPVQNGILVFTRHKTYVVTGNSPESFSKYLLDSSQGCLSHYTIKFVNGTLLWLSEDGVCASSGGLVEVITLDKLGKLTLTGVQNAAVHDKVYYLLHSSGILAIDFRHNLMIRNIQDEAKWLGMYQDKLFLQAGNAVYEAFASATPRPYIYKSGMLTEGRYSLPKIFTDFYIKSSGTIYVRLFVDGVFKKGVNLSGNTSHNLIDFVHTSGHGLEIEITGTGEVSEIQYLTYDKTNIAQSVKFEDTNDFKEIVRVNNQPIELDLTTTGYISNQLDVKPTEPKLFDNFKVKTIGSITLDIYIDNVKSTFTIDSKSLHLPSMENVLGKEIKIGYTGTGKLLSLNFDTYDKTNIAQSVKFEDTNSFKEIVRVNNQPIELDLTTTGYISSNLGLSLTNTKLFKNLMIAYTGTLTFKLYLNNSLVIEKALSATDIQVDELLIPSQYSRAYYMKFEIVGTGRIIDIEVVPLMRQTDGR